MLIHNSRSSMPWLFAALGSLVMMSIIEWLKHVIWPGISTWESHTITILLTTIIITIAARIIFRYVQMHSEAQSLMASIVESSDDGIIGQTLNGTIMSWNRGAERVFGYAPEEVLGRSISIVIPHERHEELPGIVEKVRREEHINNYETVCIRKDGKPIHVSITVSPIAGDSRTIVGTSIIVRDISERKEAEEALRESESRYHSLFSNTPTPVWVQDFSAVKIAVERLKISGVEDFHEYFRKNPGWVRELAAKIRVSDINDAVLKLHGARRKEQLMEDHLSVFVEETYEALALEFSFIAEGRTLFDFEEVVRTLDGERRFLTVRWAAAAGYESSLSRVLVSCTDITERKQATEALRETGETLQALVHASPLGIMMLDHDGRVKDLWNPAAERIFGWSREEVIGTYPPFISEEELLGFLTVMERSMKGEAFVGLESTRYKRDGSPIEISTSAAPMLSASGEIVGVMSVLTDVTERKKVEQELAKSNRQLRDLYRRLQSAREEERTRIAREIHDEFGQILTAFKIDLAWMKKQLHGDSTPLVEKIDSMSKITSAAIRSIKKLSADLRPAILDDFGLHAAIEWQAEEFERRTGTRCELEMDVGDVAFDEEISTAIFRILQETLTNVIRHARAEKVSLQLKADSGELVFQVRDNGKGISRQEINAPRSYGLMGIRERVYALGGTVEFSGSPGEGTMVCVRIPLERGRKQDDQDTYR